MVEGLGKGAGLALLAVPMADAFVFSQPQFQRILSNYLSLEGAISIPHTHQSNWEVGHTQETVIWDIPALRKIEQANDISK